MGKQSNVIEINGTKYNAITGKAVGPTAPSVMPQSSASKAVDGIKKSPVTANKASRRPVSSRTTPAHTKKTPQKSKTLMRSAVKKPATNQKSRPTQVAGISKPTLKARSERRMAAATSQKSPMVSRYGEQSAKSSVVKKVQHVPVKPHVKAVAHETKPVSLETVASHTIDAEAAQIKRSGASSVIERALANATAHEHPPHEVKKRGKLSRKFGISARVAAISSTVLAGVLLGGFFAVQNVPNLSMRVAAARAGFDATLPGYNPSGFSFAGPINHTPGQVTISYRSNTDERAYEVTQRASNWNSDALLANYVSTIEEPYQTYTDRGRTLYLYNGSNATWVDNGVWYTVEGDSQMNSDQLTRIAASM